MPFGRSTRMRPAPLSATKMSPLGAVRMIRGPARPDANRLTSKPFGTIGFCSLVRCTIRTKFRADSAISGAGKSCALISRRVPGRSVRQSPNAAVPLSKLAPVCATIGPPARVTIPATEAAMMAWIERKACSSICALWARQSPVQELSQELSQELLQALFHEPAARGGVPFAHYLCPDMCLAGGAP